MNDLELLDKLYQDPDGYWPAYDLCLLNGWAEISILPIPWWLYSDGYLFRDMEFNTDTHNSNHCGNVDSAVDGDWTSHVSKRFGTNTIIHYELY
jgi:hypothetical protein